MPTGAATTLVRDLGMWSAIAIVVGTVIGSGIFLVPKTMVQQRRHARNGVRRLGIRRRAVAIRRADVRRTGRGDAGSRRRVRLSAGGVRAVLGLCVRLDADVGRQERLDRDARHRILLLPGEFSARNWIQ